MFKNNTSFAINMKKKLDLTEKEVEFLLGATNRNKIKQIMSNFEIKKLVIQKEKNLKENTNKIQQNLFNF